MRKLVICLWITLLLALLAAPGAAAQGSDAPQLTVLAEALNVRGGPGLTYRAIGLLARGDQVPLVGQHAASGWWQVQLPGGGTGWVSGGAAYVTVSGNTADVPAVAVAGQSATAPASGPAAAQGGTIAFQTASGGDIYAVNADGTNLRRLTSGKDPSLSPDGQWVAFTRWNNDQNGALGSLWVINVNGGGERIILGEKHQPESPAWSPDGKRIVISQQHGGRVNPERKCGSDRPPREAYDIDRDRAKDGDMIICFTLPPHPHWGLRVVDAASGQFEDLPNDMFSYSPTWDPLQPAHLVFDGENGLVNLDLAQGTLSPLTGDLKDHSPAFSPDGSRIALTYWQADHWEIHALNPDGSGRARLTQTPIRAILEMQVNGNGQLPKMWNNASPAWSPDGSQIAFVTDRTGQWEVWIMNADGTNSHPLLPSAVQAGLKLRYDGMEERMLSWR